MKTTRFLSFTAGLAVAVAATLTPFTLRASDHADGPTVSTDSGADLADLYAFLDPNDNSKVVLIGTLHGFIVPGEGPNFGLFDPAVRFTFAIENTGDAVPDLFIDVTFNERHVLPGAKSPSQEATVSFRGVVPKGFGGEKGVFTGPVTQASLAASVPPPTSTPLSSTPNPSPDIDFFAGETDDPFFFDIPGFNRFVASVLAGKPDATNLNRGRDTFAGYNVMAIALRMPASLLLSPAFKKSPPTIVGVTAYTARQTDRLVNGVKVGSGPFVHVDRVGNPGVNVVFIPYNDKNAYNAATPLDDAKGVFFDDIVGTLTALGTDGPHIGILAKVVGLPPKKRTKTTDPRGTGDFLRLQTNASLAPNKSVGGNSFPHGFPNGRRIGDDVIDTLIDLVTNGGITTGDHVDSNDVPFQTVFPFLATPHQPRATGVLDDGTRN